MRITQVSTADIGGGAERVALNLHECSLEAGIDSTLAVGTVQGNFPHTYHIDNDAARSPWAQRILAHTPKIPKQGGLTRPQILARRALMALAEPSRAGWVAAGLMDIDFPATQRIIPDTTPDLVHLHNLHGSYFDIRELPGIASAQPTVLTAHDAWLTGGHCAYFVDCQKWRDGSECDICPHMDYPPLLVRDGSHENYLLKKKIFADTGKKIHLVGPAQWVIDQLEQSIFAPAIASSRVIPNGVDQSIFRAVTHEEKMRIRDELSIPHDEIVFIFSVASHNNPYKDSETIKAALDRIDPVSRPHITFIILGTVDSYALVEGIEIVGVPFLRDPSDVARYLQASDAYLHAAKAEVLPLAILEAQSCGIPAIVTDSGGARETIIDGETGFIVAQEDPDDFASALQVFLDNPEKWAGTRKAALRWARPRFSLDTMAKNYIALYEELLG